MCYIQLNLYIIEMKNDFDYLYLESQTNSLYKKFKIKNLFEFFFKCYILKVKSMIHLKESLIFS